MCAAVFQHGSPATVLKSMAKHTAPKGLGIHQITYEQIPLHVYLFGFWLRNISMGRDAEDLENYILSLSDDERRRACCTNFSSIDDLDAARAGFTVRKLSEENGDLTTILQKK